MIKLHGHPISTCTKRVATVLLEKGIPFEFVQVDFAGIKTADYKANMQPFGQIPVLEDDGYFLFESRAIGRYLAEKYADQGTPLIPTGGDLKEKGKFECAMSIEATQFLPAELLAHEAVFKPFRGGQANPDEVARLTAALTEKLDAYEQLLAKSAFLAGDKITLADIFHLPYATLATNMIKLDLFTNAEARPNVARWYKAITERDSWVKVSAGVASSA
ncbi:Glutathione S-transferase [Mycena kentingensis (nom. inval.)]|nr:Glutathione S-transferase [Mycena kentingensis (nom. inval.)]